MSNKLNFSDLISLKLIDIKREDLTENQIKIALEYNESMKEIQIAVEDSREKEGPHAVALDIQKIAVYRQRMGKMKADLDYDCKKITSLIECEYRRVWEENHFKGSNSTTCNKLAEAKAYTPEREKSLRIAEWLYDILEAAYDSSLGLINATNRLHDDLNAEMIGNNRRIPG